MTGDGTRCVRAAEPDAGLAGTPAHPGPVLSTTYQLGDPTEPAPADYYGRTSNPTWRALEAAIGELDGGECVLFPSGMAATAAVLRLLLRPGDTVVLPAEGYFAVRAFAAEELATTGVHVRHAPTAGPWAAEVVADARLVLLETPSNPGLDVCDIAAVSATAHAAGALVAVDNTTATPLGQRPLGLGADIVVASDTKAVSGHGDVVLGHVSCVDAVQAGALRNARDHGGAAPGPFEAWLSLRGLATLDLRLARQAANAEALARALRSHPAVTGVRWPGLPEDPAHQIASRQMRRWNGVIGFALADAGAVARFLAASSLVGSATSFGGLQTTADRRERWGDAVPPGFVRLSAGCEDTADLVDDVLAALAAATATDPP